MEEDWTKEAIAAGLSTRILGRSLEVYDEIDSTNRRAVEWARAGAPDGALVVADHQTQGKGRLGRQWFAPPGSALLFSLILRPPLRPMQAQRATMICSLAVVEAVAGVTGLTVGIKWPNDVMLDNGKLGGVLTELGARGVALDYVVVGMGLNVSLDLAALPPVMAPPASLLAALGRPVSRPGLLRAFLTHADDYYAALSQGWSPHEMWRDRLVTIGQAVNVGTPEEVVSGIAEDVDADGALLVRMSDGVMRRILAGDVTLRGHRIV